MLLDARWPFLMGRRYSPACITMGCLGPAFVTPTPRDRGDRSLLGGPELPERDCKDDPRHDVGGQEDDVESRKTTHRLTGTTRSLAARARTLVTLRPSRQAKIRPITIGGM